MSQNRVPTKMKNCVSGVIFTMDDSGKIDPIDTQEINVGGTILTKGISLKPPFTSVCARQGETGPCACSKVVGVASGTHMVTGTDYTISAGVPVDSTFEIYAVTDSGAVANTTNGTIHVGG